MPNPSEEKTEDKIIKSFKKLVNEYSFDKITVTMIAEDVGISRPIFYRHFKDKYELMDYMLYNEVTKELEVLLEHNMILEAIKYLFTHIINEAKLYRKLFETTGQNSFEQVMIEQFTSFFKEHLNSPEITSINVDQAVEAYYFLVSHSIFELTKENFRPKLFQAVDRNYITLPSKN